MSQTVKVKANIRDIQEFQQVCEKEGLRVNALGDIVRITDPQGQQMRNDLQLVVNGNGGYDIHMDNDPGYSAIAQRYGRNAGRLVQLYNDRMIIKTMTARRGTLAKQHVREDGAHVMQFRIRA